MSEDRSRFAVSGAIRWIARIGSLISIALLLMFMFGGEESISFSNVREMIGFSLFPIGVIIGMILGWKNDMLGGGVVFVSLAGFYLWHFLEAGKFASGPFFFFFSSPGLFFLLAPLASRFEKSS